MTQYDVVGGWVETTSVTNFSHWMCIEASYCTMYAKPLFTSFFLCCVTGSQYKRMHNYTEKIPHCVKLCILITSGRNQRKKRYFSYRGSQWLKFVTLGCFFTLGLYPPTHYVILRHVMIFI